MRWSSTLVAASLGVAAGLAAGSPVPTPTPTKLQTQPRAQSPSQSDARVPTHRGALSPALDARWQQSLDAFAAADRLHPPVAGGVLFIGSSSIRLWDGLETAFGETPVIRRGFGGSRLSDCARHVDQLVLPYRPRVVVLYAGDNDVWEGRSPQEVLESLRLFTRHVREDLPGTRIAYVSIKPSPRRASILPQVRATNALIERYAAREPGLEYVDVYSKMVDVHGVPRDDLYLPDSLHLNRDGYAIWKAAIAQHLHAARPRHAR